MGTTAVALQQAINRYSVDKDIGFSPIGVDPASLPDANAIGPLTFNALMLALTSAANVGTADGEQAAAWLGCGGGIGQFGDCSGGLLQTQNDVLNNAADITGVLNRVADQLGLPGASSPQVHAPPGAPSGSSRAPIVPTAPQTAATVAKHESKAGASAGILGLGLPDWVVYGGLSLLAIGVGALIYRKRKATPVRRVYARSSFFPGAGA